MSVNASDNRKGRHYISPSLEEKCSDDPCGCQAIIFAH